MINYNTTSPELFTPIIFGNYLAKITLNVHKTTSAIFFATFPFMQSARCLYLYVRSFFLHRKALARGQLLRLCICVAPPIEYTWCQFKMTSWKCPYLSKPQVIILTSYNIAMKHCTSHKTSTASYSRSPAHRPKFCIFTAFL